MSFQYLVIAIVLVILLVPVASAVVEMVLLPMWACVTAHSGFALIHLLRNHPRTRDLPIIVLTGLTLASIRQQAREAGCQRFLLKPCLPAALAGEIRDVLLAEDDVSV